MNAKTTTRRAAAPTDEARSVATLRFRRDQQSSGVSRSGRLQQGGLVRVEYDPARLAPQQNGAGSDTSIVCHVWCEPGGEELSGNLLPASVLSAPVAARPAVFEARIPPGTRAIQIWFESRGPAGQTGWDSRYGRNFRFPVAEQGLAIPEQSVALRPEAVADPARIEVVKDAASKAHATFGTGGSSLETGLSIRARIRCSAEPISAWADVHVFDAMCELIHAETIALRAPERRSSHAPVAAWEGEVYHGSGGGSGTGVWSRPDAHTVQYRLYCQIGHHVFTDSILHEFEVPADAEVRPIPGSW